MSWIKRNLSLVISGAIALGLLGFGGWYLWSAIQKNNAIDTEIGGTKSEIERLLNMDPAPNASNLNTLQREFKRLTDFNAQAKNFFPATPVPPGPLNNQSFKSLLQNTINELNKHASSVGITVESNYYFTFESQRLPVTFAPESLRPLSERLKVQLIASILFQARVNRLEGMRRAMVPGEQQAANTAGDYLNIQPRGNAETGMILWPYEVTFQCFTSELAGVLEALQRAQYGFVVKAPSSEPVRDLALPPRRTNAPPGLITVINEKLLRVTLRIEVIKPEGGDQEGRMEFLRNIPGLLKRHYEKVILGLALIGLLGAVVYLNKMKSAENEKIESYNRGIIKRKSKPIQTVDASALTTALMHATNPPSITLAPPHNLLNPVKWQQRPDKSLLKVETGREIGPNAAEVAKIMPLRLIITLDGQSGSGVNMSVMPETNKFVRSKLQSFITTNSPSERIHRTRFFTLRDLKIAPDGPVAEIELADGTKETVTPAKPFSRVDGYRADLGYPPEKKTFTDRRVGDVLTLNSEDYIIVAITTNEVVVSARSNDRRTIIRNNAAP